ncbi:MAG: UbiA family prenyltransferase, partial [Streptosporangiaceae bacterium]
MALVTTSYGIRPDTRNLLKICFLCFRESRPIVQAMCLLRFATGVILGATVGGPPDSPRALGGALAWVAAAFTIYLYNGVSDITEDRRNGSNRPVARGDLSLRDAMVGTAVASIVSLSVAVWCGGLLALLVLALLAAGYAYSSPPFLWKQHIAGVFFTGTAITFLSLYAGYTCFAGTMVADRQTVIMIVMFSLWTGLVG